jgi:iron complex transport system permease protein
MRAVNVKLALLGLFALAVLFAAPWVGLSATPFSVILHPFAHTPEADIFWRFRVPRVLVAFLAGAGLAAGGTAFQAMFRNPLATPFTLGVSSGAAFGAALYVQLGLPALVFIFPGGTAFALAGAALSILVVYALARAHPERSVATLLLAGVALSFFFSSLLLFLQYMTDITRSFRINRWLMGSVQADGFADVTGLLPFVAVGAAVLLAFAHELNLLTTGDELASSRGVDVGRTQTVLFFAVSLTVGGIVALCGPIGFVGMMVPHMCRLWISPDHRTLVPASLLAGGAFLAACDTFARTVIAPAEVPVGVITALLGGPFFLWLLASRGRRDAAGGELA